MPKIPWFRDWYECKFGDLCYYHDLDYYMGHDKDRADKRFYEGIKARGYPIIARLTLWAMKLPWVGKG
jgi:hypothetical protein